MREAWHAARPALVREGEPHYNGAMIYLLSYVIRGEAGSGKIAESDHYPVAGEEISLDGRRYRILSVEDLIPPRAKICYVHVLCEAV